MLMLGPGRPFLVELKNPKRGFSLDVAAARDLCADVQRLINLQNKGLLEVEGLRVAREEDKAEVLRGEMTRGKVYRFFFEEMERSGRLILKI